MTGAGLVTAILQDAFPTGRRAQALDWLNYRVGLLWSGEEWEFVQGTKNDVSITAGDNTLDDLPDDMGPVLAVIPPNRDPLTPYDEYRDFASVYIGPGAITPGLPVAFNVTAGTVFVGPTSTETSDEYQLVYERLPPTVADTGDPMPLPEAFSGALIDGGKARGFTLTNNPLAAGFEANYQSGLQSLRRLYLRSMRGTSTQAPAYRPGGLFGWDGWGW